MSPWSSTADKPSKRTTSNLSRSWGRAAMELYFWCPRPHTNVNCIQLSARTRSSSSRSPSSDASSSSRSASWKAWNIKTSSSWCAHLKVPIPICRWWLDFHAYGVLRSRKHCYHPIPPKTVPFLLPLVLHNCPVTYSRFNLYAFSQHHTQRHQTVKYPQKKSQ